MDPQSEPGCCCCQGGSPGQKDRRGFIAGLSALVLGGLAVLGPAVAAVVAFFSPVCRKGQAGRWLRAAALDALPEDGQPAAFRVFDDRSDAWNYFPNQPVGTVFVSRPDPKQDPVALQSTCPHVGCEVEYSSALKQFLCPCHRAFFEMDGKPFFGADGKLTNPSPRGLDPLEVELRGEKKDEVWVKFERFRTGTTQRIPLS
jgi:menaquinol-cytochrome c reductase iron-sulfur subunit